MKSCGCGKYGVCDIDYVTRETSCICEKNYKGQHCEIC